MAWSARRKHEDDLPRRGWTRMSIYHGEHGAHGERPGELMRAPESSLLGALRALRGEQSSGIDRSNLCRPRRVLVRVSPLRLHGATATTQHTARRTRG